MNKRILLIGIICLLYLGLFADVKIAYVNTELIFAELQEVQDAKQILNEDIKTWEDELSELETELEQLETEYEEKKLILTQASKEEALQKITELKKQVKDKYKEIYGENGKIIQRNNELLEPVMEKLAQAIEKISVDENLTIVFDSSAQGILYAKPSIDITEDVIDEIKNLKE